MDDSLRELIRTNPYIWSGDDACQERASGIPTGHASLDAILPSGGWPQNAVIELITPHWGMGELQLLLPLMKSMTRQKRWILWVCPPYIPYAPALVNADIDIDFLMTIGPNISCQDALWTIEKALQSQGCGLLMTWLNHLPNGVVRRLQLAAASGETSCVLFRNQRGKNSPAALQLQLNHSNRGIQARVLKARGAHQYRSVNIPANHSRDNPTMTRSSMPPTPSVNIPANHSRDNGNPVDNKTPYKEGLLTGSRPHSTPYGGKRSREWEL